MQLSKLLLILALSIIMISCSDDDDDGNNPNGPGGGVTEFKDGRIDFQLSGSNSGNFSFQEVNFTLDANIPGYGYMLLICSEEGNMDKMVTIYIADNQSGPLSNRSYPLINYEIIESENGYYTGGAVTLDLENDNYESEPGSGSIVITASDENYFEGTFTATMTNSFDQNDEVTISGSFIYNNRD